MVDHKTRRVYYDKNKERYTKEFYPKIQEKFKYFFKLRKYPGENFDLVAKTLNKIGIKTPKIIEYSKYKVVMEELKGTLLSEYLNKNKDSVVIENFLNLIVKVLKNKIYHSDFAPRNFLIKDGEIFAIDLEDYMVGVITLKTKEELRKRLKKALRNDDWVRYIEERL